MSPVERAKEAIASISSSALLNWLCATLSTGILILCGLIYNEFKQTADQVEKNRIEIVQNREVLAVLSERREWTKETLQRIERTVDSLALDIRELDRRTNGVNGKQ